MMQVEEVRVHGRANFRPRPYLLGGTARRLDKDYGERAKNVIHVPQRDVVQWIPELEGAPCWFDIMHD